MSSVAILRASADLREKPFILIMAVAIAVTVVAAVGARRPHAQ
jgi:hypothetical protein